MEVGCVTRKGYPPEGTLAFAKQGPDVLGNEAGDLESIGDSGVACLRADVVAVVDGDGSTTLERDHRLHVRGDAPYRPLHALPRRAPPPPCPRLHTQPPRDG